MTPLLPRGRSWTFGSVGRGPGAWPEGRLGRGPEPAGRAHSLRAVWPPGGGGADRGRRGDESGTQDKSPLHGASRRRASNWPVQP